MRYAELQTSIKKSVAIATQPSAEQSLEVQLEHIGTSIKAINEQLSVLLLSHASASICRRRCEQKLDALMSLVDTHNVAHRKTHIH